MTSPWHHEKHHEPSAFTVSSMLPSRSTNLPCSRGAGSVPCRAEPGPWIQWELGPNVQVGTSQAMVMVHFHISFSWHTPYSFSPSFASAEPPKQEYFQASSRNCINTIKTHPPCGFWDGPPCTGRCGHVLVSERLKDLRWLFPTIRQI